MAKLVRQQTATLLSSVRVRLEPPLAQVAKLVDAQDLKSCGPLKSVPVRFRPWAPNIENKALLCTKMYMIELLLVINLLI